VATPLAFLFTDNSNEIYLEDKKSKTDLIGKVVYNMLAFQVLWML